MIGLVSLNLKIREGKERCRLDMSMTIFDPSTHAPSSTSALKVPIRILQTSPKKHSLFADEYVQFVNEGKIMKFESIDETLAPPGYTIAPLDETHLDAVSGLI